MRLGVTLSRGVSFHERRPSFHFDQHRQATHQRRAGRSDEDRVAAITFYFFSPDVVADVCAELGLPWRSNGYRYWQSSVAG
jgi:hypothetical protein